MNPVFDIGLFTKLRNFEILSVLYLIRILLSGPIHSFWSNFAIMSDSHYLTLEQMFFPALKFRICLDLRVQIASECILN